MVHELFTFYKQKFVMKVELLLTFIYFFAYNLIKCLNAFYTTFFLL